MCPEASFEGNDKLTIELNVSFIAIGLLGFPLLHIICSKTYDYLYVDNNSHLDNNENRGVWIAEWVHYNQSHHCIDALNLAKLV